MSSPFSQLATLEYPGRLLMLGRDPSGEHDVIAYAVTGRSASSRARRLEFAHDGTLSTQVTDLDTLQRGNPQLLIYPCIQRLHQRWFVSNGAQTQLLRDVAEDCRDGLSRLTPLELLVEAMAQPVWVDGNNPGEYIDLTSFEPDGPTFTPRISGILGDGNAAMSIIKSIDGQTARAYFEFPLLSGKARMLCTYSGQNVPSGAPIPSFSGEPLFVDLAASSAEDLATQLFEALGPKQPAEGILAPGEDFRVGVAALFIHRQKHSVTTHVLNSIDAPS